MQLNGVKEILLFWQMKRTFEIIIEKWEINETIERKMDT
jgi:hypothetical protein